MNRKKRPSAGRSILFRIAKTAGWITLFFMVFSTLQVLIVRFVNPRLTMPIVVHWVTDRLHLAEKPFVRYRQAWRDLEAISPHLRRAVVAAEDQRFLDHRGFDFHEMAISIKDAFSNGRVRGASTISMQAARSVFLWPSRTLLRKVVEAWYTVLMETLWPKRRILEVYLNTVDWGGAIIGAESAARHYFKVSSERLTRYQAAALASVLPAPGKWSPTRPSTHVKNRINRIVSDMKKVPLVR